MPAMMFRVHAVADHDRVPEWTPASAGRRSSSTGWACPRSRTRRSVPARWARSARQAGTIRLRRGRQVGVRGRSASPRRYTRRNGLWDLLQVIGGGLADHDIVGFTSLLGDALVVEALVIRAPPPRRRCTRAMAVQEVGVLQSAGVEVGLGPPPGPCAPASCWSSLGLSGWSW